MLCLDSLSLQLQLRSAPIHFDMTVTRIEVIGEHVSLTCQAERVVSASPSCLEWD